MILQLLKKDCIIAKNYVVAVILIGVGLPVLLVWRQPEMLEVFALPGAVFISSVAFNLAVSEKENKYPKATALLCATPYNNMLIHRSVLTFAHHPHLPNRKRACFLRSVPEAL